MIEIEKIRETFRIVASDLNHNIDTWTLLNTVITSAKNLNFSESELAEPFDTLDILNHRMNEINRIKDDLRTYQNNGDHGNLAAVLQHANSLDYLLSWDPKDEELPMMLKAATIAVDEQAKLDHLNEINRLKYNLQAVTLSASHNKSDVSSIKLLQQTIMSAEQLGLANDELIQARGLLKNLNEKMNEVNQIKHDLQIYKDAGDIDKLEAVLKHVDSLEYLLSWDPSDEELPMIIATAKLALKQAEVNKLKENLETAIDNASKPSANFTTLTSLRDAVSSARTAGVPDNEALMINASNLLQILDGKAMKVIQTKTDLQTNLDSGDLSNLTAALNYANSLEYMKDWNHNDQELPMLLEAASLVVEKANMDTLVEIEKVEQELVSVKKLASEGLVNVNLFMALQETLQKAESLNLSDNELTEAQSLLGTLNNKINEVNKIESDLQIYLENGDVNAIAYVLENIDTLNYDIKSWNPDNVELEMILNKANQINTIKEQFQTALGGATDDLNSLTLLQASVTSAKEADFPENNELVVNANNLLQSLKDKDIKINQIKTDLKTHLTSGNLKKTTEILKHAETLEYLASWNPNDEKLMKLLEDAKQNEAELISQEKIKMNLQNNLNKACSSRNVDELETSIKDIDTAISTHFLHECMLDDVIFASDINQGRDLLNRLQELKNRRLALLDLQLTEIKTYTNPPSVVIAVMKATYFLLGEKERDLMNWEPIRALLMKVGGSSLKEKAFRCNPSNIRLNVAIRAESFVQDLRIEDVRKKSKAIATFLEWVHSILTEVYDRNGIDYNFS